MSLRVNFCAAPSSGKSTVCAALEAKLKQEGVIVDTSKEYVRQYINTYGVPTELYEQFIIMDNQKTRDEAIDKVSEVTLTDRPVVNDYIFSNKMLYQKIQLDGRSRRQLTKPEKKFLEETYIKCLERVYWFDIIFVFPPLDYVVDDGTRTETSSDVFEIYNAIKGFLDSEYINYHYVDGTVEEKVDYCFKVIMEELRERKTFAPKSKSGKK